MCGKIVKRVAAAVSSVVLLLGLASQSFAAGAPGTFVDVGSSDWYYPYVEQVAQKGWISGYPDGSFGPDKPVSYADFCTMIVNAYFQEELTGYTGERDPWYLPYCRTAANQSLFTNTGAKNHINPLYTDPDMAASPVTRGDMAIMICNILREKGMLGFVPDSEISAVRANTPDVMDGITPGSFEIYIAKAAGILTGVDSNGTFAADQSMTRAQAAVVLTKIAGLLG